MTDREKAPAWTDEEIGFLLDNWSLPMKQLAEELGRTPGAVAGKRMAIRRGWTPRMTFWTEEEDQVILESGPYTTLRQLAEQLPGRSEKVIKTRRERLGVEVAHRQNQLPGTIGARPLLAKTCIDCGRLLQAEWFGFSTGSRRWNSHCRQCHTTRTAATPAYNDRSGHSSTESYYRLQRLTSERATRTGEEYTDADHEVLADPDLTVLQKALRISRSYAATMGVVKRNGYKSHVGLGEPTDLWRIFNPNDPKQVA